MKNYINLIAMLMILGSGCTPVKSPINNQYKLDSFCAKRVSNKVGAHSLLISQPDAVAGYQTEQMLYTAKPYELNAFAHNAWISPPANMLYPLMTQSLQKTHYFYAVASGPNADKTDYRIDTQLIAFQQNFIVKPSIFELKVQAVLTHVSDNRIIASRIFDEKVVCPSDTPYGGVMAANKAALQFTTALTHFVVSHIEKN